MNIRSFVIEALKASEFRELMLIGRELANERINQIWPNLESLAANKSKRNDRLYFNYDSNLQDLHLSDNSRSIIDFIKSYGYNVIDYVKGIAVKDGKEFKISKILLELIKEGNASAEIFLKRFNQDEGRSGKSGNLLMVISKHPYDIGGASTDRGWTSCINLRGGLNKHYVPIDISRGSIISYLIYAKDLNINKPLARVLIKPYLSLEEKDRVLYGIENETVKYGSANPSYIKQLMLILDKAQKEKTGFFKIDSNLYSDGATKITKGNITPASRFLMQANYPAYEKNEDGSFSFFDSVTLVDAQFYNLPFNIRYCNGNFIVDNNFFSNLNGFPVKVGGEFSCNSNRLTTLENGPKHVGNNYYCADNKLSSLKGCPLKINGAFLCSNNNLNSLEYGPQHAIGYFCGYNQLETLFGAPKIVDGNFDCSVNRLETLEYGPKIVKGEYNCAENRLINLIGAPEMIPSNFYISGNRDLKTLKGFPKKIGGNLFLRNTPISENFTEEEIRNVCKIDGVIIGLKRN